MILVKYVGVLVKYEGYSGKILWKKMISATMASKTKLEQTSGGDKSWQF